MDLEVLKDDNVIDVLNTAQMYSMELWIDTIDTTKGKHVNFQEETASKLDGGDSEATANGKHGNDFSTKSNLSMTSAESVKSKKSVIDTKKSKKQEAKHKKKSKDIKAQKAGSQKKSIYTLEVTTGDYILPSGLKPFRVRFTILNRNVTLTQLDYDKIFQIKQMLQVTTATSEQSIVPPDNMSLETGHEEDKQVSTKEEEGVEKLTPSMEKLPGVEKEASAEKLQTAEKMPTSEKSKSNISRRAKSKKSLSQMAEKSSSAPGKSAARSESPGVSEASTKMKTEDLTKLLKVFGKSNECDYKVNVDELSEILEDDAFAPQSENNMKKGCSVTVAMTPMLVIRALQCGSIQLTVDRFGGRKEDEGDPIGYATVKIPSDWQETVLHAATNPRITPVTLKVSNKVTIDEKPDNKPVGTLDYTLILTCYAGCITSNGMPTFIGLCVSLAEGKKTVCHKPMIRDNINIHSLKRKAIDEDYEKLYKARPFKMQKKC